MLRTKSLLFKLVLIPLAIIICCGILVNAFIIDKVKSSYLKSSEEIIRNSEKALLNIASKDMETSQDILEKYANNVVEDYEKGLSEIAFDLYNGDETKIKKAIKAKALSDKERSTKNFEILSAIMLEQTIKNIGAKIEQFRNNEAGRVLDMSRQIENRIIMVSLLAILSYILFNGFWIYKAVISPVSELLKGTKKIANGDLTHTIRVDSEDEFGDLFTSFNRMTRDLKASREEMALEKNYVNNIVTSMRDMLIVISTAGYIQTVNRALCDLLDYEEEALIGQPVGKVMEDELSPGFDEARIMEFIEEAEKTYIARDGSRICALFSGSIMHDDRGNIQGIVCVAQDITGRKKAEEELKKKMHDLKRFNRLAVGRELDMKKLKNKVKELEAKLGERQVQI